LVGGRARGVLGVGNGCTSKGDEKSAENPVIGEFDEVVDGDKLDVDWGEGKG
jgi:hypothetical protein